MMMAAYVQTGHERYHMVDTVGRTSSEVRREEKEDSSVLLG